MRDCQSGLNDEIHPRIRRRELDDPFFCSKRSIVVKDLKRGGVPPVDEEGDGADVPFEEVIVVVADGYGAVFGHGGGGSGVEGEVGNG